MVIIDKIPSYKKYKFLCNYDTVSLYDMVEDPRYTTKMMVVGFTCDTNRVQQGITLKDIYITKVTLEQAIEWHNGGNSTLRTLALSAYTEDELKLSFKYINSRVSNTCFCANVPANEAEKYNTLVDLAVIAKFFNGSWKKTTGNTGYFLGCYNYSSGSAIYAGFGVGVYQHNAIQYAGIVYFRNQEDAIKAVKILGNRVKNLFD